VRVYLEPVIPQAAEEFPAALAELRSRLPVDDGPIDVVGGSNSGSPSLIFSYQAESRIPAKSVWQLSTRSGSMSAASRTGTGWRSCLMRIGPGL